MFDEKLQKFLNANEACLGGITRLQDLGVETLEQAWDKASDEDLIWAVTRPGVMNPEQQRLFLVMVLSSIEYKLTDPRSKNILEKLRTNEAITNEDLDAASDAAWAAAMAAASDAVMDARAMWVASDAVRTAAMAAASDAVMDAAWDAASDASDSRDAWDAQAKWVHKNFKLCNLHTN